MYNLDVTVVSGKVTITALPIITELWGTDMSLKTAELQFDLEGLNGEIIWTPVVGTISVIGDVSGIGVLS